jgi:hypothetical protein
MMIDQSMTEDEISFFMFTSLLTVLSPHPLF